MRHPIRRHTMHSLRMNCYDVRFHLAHTMNSYAYNIRYTYAYDPMAVCWLKSCDLGGPSVISDFYIASCSSCPLSRLMLAINLETPKYPASKP